MKTRTIKQGMKVIVLALSVVAINAFGSKADTISSSQQGVVLRSTNLVSNKTIKVPKKEQEIKVNQSVATKASSNVSYSRGGNETTANLISYAFKFIGRPYVFGASGPKAFDCSGYTAYVYGAYGVDLPHYTGSQFQMGQAVSKSNLLPGDLVFFNTYGPISHVGIYIGGGEFIHAASGSKNVTVSDLSESYYAKRYAGARRIFR